MAKTNQELVLDYSGRFTAPYASAATALTSVAVTTLGAAAGTPWEAAAISGGVISLAAWATSAARAKFNRPHAVGRALAACWAVWTTEVAAAIALDPYTWMQTPSGYWTALCAFVTTWALTWWAFDKADITDEAHFILNLANGVGAPVEEGEMLLQQLAHDHIGGGIAQRWGKEINDVLKFTPEILDVVFWQKVGGVSPGFTMPMNLPKGASAAQFTDTALAQMAQDVEHHDLVTGEITRGLPNGCSVSIAKGDRQGQILMHVPTINPDELVVDHPADWSPLSINGRIPLSFTPHGQEITSLMREAGAIIVGPPGTGKSTFLNNMLSSFARCEDVLVWGIDTSKGRDGVFGHWVNDLPEGAKPLVTRVAVNNREALDLAEAGLREAAARLTEHRQWMKEHNTDLVPISKDCPMLFLVFDEGAEIFSSEGRDADRDRLRAKVIELLRTTRQAGIRCVFTFVDINLASVGVTDLLKFSSIKIALTGDGNSANTDAVIRFWGRPKGMDIDQLMAKGIGVGQFGKGPQVHRGPRMLPELIEACTVATSANRPPRDLVCAEWTAGESSTVTVSGSIGEPEAGAADDLGDLSDLRSALGGEELQLKAADAVDPLDGMDVEADFRALTSGWDQGDQGKPEKRSEGGYEPPADLFDDE